jgi:hypothetical protein
MYTTLAYACILCPKNEPLRQLIYYRPIPMYDYIEYIYLYKIKYVFIPVKHRYSTYKDTEHVKMVPIYVHKYVQIVHTYNFYIYCTLYSYVCICSSVSCTGIKIIGLINYPHTAHTL